MVIVNYELALNLSGKFNEDALLLIHEYQKYTLLWNPKHKEHLNKIKKNDAWEEIAKTCKC